MRRTTVIWVVLCLCSACYPPGQNPRGAAGLQESPVEVGPYAPPAPMRRPVGGVEGAPPQPRGPAQGSAAPPRPFWSPVTVWPSMTFEPQLPMRRGRASARRPASRPRRGGGQGRADAGGGTAREGGGEVAAAPTGPEDLVSPSYGPEPPGGAASTYPDDSRTRDEVRYGMESVRRRLEGCFPEGFPGGILRADVVIAPEGHVEDVLVAETIPDAQADCVEGVFAQARFRQISGEYLQVLYPYAQAGAVDPGSGSGEASETDGEEGAPRDDGE